MRSLASKLTLAFLLVGLTGAILVAFFVRQRTQREFDRLILDQNQQTLVDNITHYYQVNRSWEGVESIFRPQGSSPAPNPNFEPRWEVRRTLFTIANTQGVVVAGGKREDLGRVISQSDLKKGEPLIVDGETVGWLLFNPALDRWRADTPEGNFLLNVGQATLYSAIAATLVALLLGGFLAYNLTRSLRELTVATQALAKGELGQQVKVRSQDELGALATSFNQMSAELARANQLRRKMTADIAHDLRTPLSVILGYSEALADGKLAPNVETFDILHTEAKHLSYLIEDLKTLSLADAGELPLDTQPVSPQVLMRRAAGAYRVQAEQKQVQVSMEVPADLPEIVVDADRVAQVLGNLMSNALRYTPTGGEIMLSAGLSNRGEVYLSVSDNGAGIDADDMPNIFERSFRGDQARQNIQGESGLGLAIAKSLVEAQGGTISVESRLGEGTRFTIVFPLAT